VKNEAIHTRFQSIIQLEQPQIENEYAKRELLENDARATMDSTKTPLEHKPFHSEYIQTKYLVAQTINADQIR
jgi:hypothetical protein